MQAKRTYRPGTLMIWLIAACLGKALTPFHAAALPPGSGSAQAPPNIVFIFTDDQRYNTIRALGGNEILTPNLDALVASGTTFTHAFNMGGWHGAICVASRTMLLTGLSLWQAQRVERDLSGLVSSGALWVQQLKTAGYETYLTGKWHVRTDASRIFDHVVHERPGMPNQTPEGYYRPKSPADTLWSASNPRFDGFWKGGRHWSEVLADDAAGFMETASRSAAPFFMYLAFNAPHDPRQAPQRFLDLYPADQIKIPASYLSEYPFKEEAGTGIDLRDEQLAPFPRSEYAVRKHIQEYYASITHLDEQVGKILAALRKTGKLDNTYIFFTSDHGLAVGHHGLMGKQNMYDHSLRVPLVVAGPGIPKGETRHQLVYLQDIVPTTCQLAKVQKPAPAYYHSLLPLIRDKKAPSSYPEIYGAYMNLQRMVRTDRYKLLVYPEMEKVMLFDLKSDPEERNDVAGEQKYRQILDEMGRRLVSQQRQLGDTLQLKGLIDQYSGRPARKKRGWEPLLKNSDLSHWRSVASSSPPAKGWVISNGELTVLKGRTGGDIMTRNTYGNFELKLDFRLTRSSNSGIKYLVNKNRNAQTGKLSYMGIEYQIIDDENYEAVKILPESNISTGAVYLLYPPSAKTLYPPGQWNSLRILVKGDYAEHWLNGKKIASYSRKSEDFRARLKETKFRDYPDYALADTGHILIQDHGDQVSYRNIMIRQLD